jgi:ParB-like chromosome segregation protein Spo0J
MRVLAEFKEPLSGYSQKLVLAPLEELRVIEDQRKPSGYYIRRLSESMRKIGFVTPLTAIEKEGKLVVIDGQHRLLAAKQAGIGELTCMVIPEEHARKLMELNVENLSPFESGVM